jgi:hypothetical protein
MYLVFWKLKHCTLTSVVGPPELVKEALSRDNHGTNANRVVLRHAVPVGATAWRTDPTAPLRTGHESFDLTAALQWSL